MKQAIIILLAIGAMIDISTTAHADIIRGRVVDSETKEPLAEGSVKLTYHGTWP